MENRNDSPFNKMSNRQLMIFGIIAIAMIVIINLIAQLF